MFRHLARQSREEPADDEYHRLSDAALMTRLSRRDDPAALEVLFRRYAAPAYRLALSLTTAAHDAEDAVQEAFLRVIRSRETYREGRRFAPWFYTVLRNVCRDQVRRAGPVLAERNEEAPADPASDPAFSVERREAVEAALEAFQRLPLPEREVLALRLYAGLTLAEVAAACGSSVEAVKKRSQRGLARLRRSLAREI